MTIAHTLWRTALAVSLSIGLLSACGGGSRSGEARDGSGGGGGGSARDGRTYLIKPGASATRDMIAAMVQAAPGDTIRFDCGYFELESSLQLTDTEDVLVKGCGKDRTVLSFKHNNAPEGILGVNVHGLWIEDLTVLDTAGNGIELRSVDQAALRRVRAIWSSNGGRESPTPITGENVFADGARLLHVACTRPATLDPNAPENTGREETRSPDYTVSPKSGRYGIYPVSSENILIEEAESVGASDAGIYVGQTNNAIIRKSRAAFNVFGFEIENVRGGEYDSNLAECNTGGFLVYDLDGLRQYGDRSRMHGNVSRMNNTYNFTSGGFVGNVPAGSGMITLSYDRIDVYDNLFESNNTGGIIHASYELFPEGAGRPFEKRIDWYTEGLHIYRNTFRNNGAKLPAPTSKDLQSVDVAKFLPLIVGLKNQAACLNPLNLATCAAAGGSGYQGAAIVWDGLLDSWSDCAYPLDAEGKPVPKDERGKPQLGSEHPNPECHYNQYKFNADKQRITPDWWASCIDDDNVFEGSGLRFANFHGLKGLEPVVAALTADPAAGPDALVHVLNGLASTDLLNFASSFDIKPHQCAAAYGRNLAPLPAVVIPPFRRSGDYAPAPTEEEIRHLCEGGRDGEINFAAAARVNCPTLDQYHLFEDAQDPRSTPRGRGLPFSLNSKLFSDYSVKYRVAFLPEGTSAVYHDAREGGAVTGANMTLSFPPNTIIAKTFTFADEQAGTEVPLETRLLIKRVTASGKLRWVGLPYVWETVNGRRVARLALGGATASVHWNTTDVDSGVRHQGSTDSYLVPHGNQCLSCHSREDGEPGSAPIGTKVRFMNKPFRPESDFVPVTHPVKGRNQIAYWCSSGLLSGCPSDLGVDATTQLATRLERVPAFNKPGDAGFPAGSDADIESRARAWLEVNCQHCHNVRGFAASTGLYLDSLRKVDSTYGICKRPTATGREGTDNGTRFHDINPGNLADSILPFRIGPTATTPAARMPPLARSVVDEEGHALVEQWIRDVIKVDETKYPGSSSCGG